MSAEERSAEEKMRSAIRTLVSGPMASNLEGHPPGISPLPDGQYLVATREGRAYAVIGEEMYKHLLRHANFEGNFGTAQQSKEIFAQSTPQIAYAFCGEHYDPPMAKPHDRFVPRHPRRVRKRRR